MPGGSSGTLSVEGYPTGGPCSESSSLHGHRSDSQGDSPHDVREEAHPPARGTRRAAVCTEAPAACSAQVVPLGGIDRRLHPVAHRPTSPTRSRTQEGPPRPAALPHRCVVTATSFLFAGARLPDLLRPARAVLRGGHLRSDATHTQRWITSSYQRYAGSRPRACARDTSIARYVPRALPCTRARVFGSRRTVSHGRCSRMLAPFGSPVARCYPGRVRSARPALITPR
jgi:hypothetical protein